MDVETLAISASFLVTGVVLHVKSPYVDVFAERNLQSAIRVEGMDFVVGKAASGLNIEFETTFALCFLYTPEL